MDSPPDLGRFRLGGQETREGGISRAINAERQVCGGLRRFATIHDVYGFLRQITMFCDNPDTRAVCEKGKKHRERNIKGCFTWVLIFLPMLCVLIGLERCTESRGRLTFV